MTAVIHPSAVVTGEFTNLTETQRTGTQLAEPPSLTDQLEEFLRDPIGHGSYDFSDPITLAEFETTRHYRGRYITALARS